MARTKVYVPRETAAISMGADEVALEIARINKSSGTDIELIRNGSWGASYLEPLVEVEVAEAGDELVGSTASAVTETAGVAKHVQLEVVDLS